MAENKNYTEQEDHSKVIKGNVKVDKPKLSKRLVNFLLSDKLVLGVAQFFQSGLQAL